MASFEFLAVIVSVLGLAASIMYYANVLNNANKTQKMQLDARSQQLFMQLYQQMSSPEAIRTWIEIMKWEFTDFDDFKSKYGFKVNEDAYIKRSSLWRRYNVMGIMLRDGRISPDLLYDYVGSGVILMWNKFESIIKKNRELRNNPEQLEWFDYFVEEMNTVREKRGLTTPLVDYITNTE
jgi:hypothetical protein